MRRNAQRNRCRQLSKGAAGEVSDPPSISRIPFSGFVLAALAVRLLLSCVNTSSCSGKGWPVLAAVAGRTGWGIMLTLTLVVMQGRFHDEPATLGRLVSASKDLWDMRLQLPLNLSSIPFAGTPKQLAALRLRYCVTALRLTAAHDLVRVACPVLEWLHVAPRRDSLDLRPLKLCHALHTLLLSGCSGVAKVAPLAYMRSLAHLDLSHATRLETVDDLGHSSSLHDLKLCGCCRLRQVAGLAMCPSLESLDLSGCGMIRDIDTLAHCPSLQRLLLSCQTPCSAAAVGL